MEFPHLGEHCGVKSCNLLDFLPVKCDACSGIFCKDHLSYDSHTCSQSHTKNVQVPICPLCQKLCPIRKELGETADIVVGRHIDGECQSDPAKERRKIYDNRCNFKKCKKKELIPLKCSDCNINFCLTHRHPLDHNCKGLRTARNAAADAAMRRQQQQGATSNASKPGQSSILSYFSSSSNPTPQPSRPAAPQPSRVPTQPARPSRPNRRSEFQGTMTEDEALAAALQASMAEAANPAPNTENQEELDRMAALALDQSLNGARAQGQQQAQTSGNGDKNCVIS